MTNLLILPILIPTITAILFLFFREQIYIQRIGAVLVPIVNGILLVYLLYSHESEILVTLIGNWPIPFGIPLVFDSLSGIILVSIHIVYLFSLIFSFYSIDTGREKHGYYSMMLMILAGSSGILLTGDIFNLFVFFEITLISTYSLMVLGGTKIQLRETLKYLLINVILSAFFLISIGYLYSLVGSLNLADISDKLTSIGDSNLIFISAILFLFVFGTKSALFPLFFWLPGSYRAVPIPILVLFSAVLTKVGFYAFVRTFSLFYQQEWATLELIFFAIALLTIVVGMIGAFGSSDITTSFIYQIMISMGILLFAFTLFTETSVNGMMIYLIHDVFAKAYLFMIVGIGKKHFQRDDRIDDSTTAIKKPLFAFLFFMAILISVGTPPFPGFIGKYLIVQAAFEKGHWIGAIVVLLSSFVVLLTMIRFWMSWFWGTSQAPTEKKFLPVFYGFIALFVFITGIGLSMEAIYPVIKEASQMILNYQNYIDALLGG